jgi:DNA-binding NarL/FixJ family response regulator
MNCLVLANPQKQIAVEIDRYLKDHSVPVTLISDAILGIQKVQEQHFDVIILDAKLQGVGIEDTIRLLKGADPQARIIVRTEENSRPLETAIRREKVYYFHVDSLGMQELQLAISSALGLH